MKSSLDSRSTAETPGSDAISHSSPSPSKGWPLWLQLGLALLAALLLINLITAPLARHMVSDFLFKQVDEQSRSAFALLSATGYRCGDRGGYSFGWETVMAQALGADAQHVRTFY